MSDALRPLHNARAIPVAELPLLSLDRFREEILIAVESGGRIVSLFGQPAGDALRLYGAVATPEGGLAVGCADVTGDGYPALTPDCIQAHLFEREIAEQWGLRPEGHPWLKPVRYHRPLAGRA